METSPVSERRAASVGWADLPLPPTEPIDMIAILRQQSDRDAADR